MQHRWQVRPATDGAFRTDGERTMFRVELFVDDKKLGDVLRLVQGIALQQPSVDPVVNAKVGKNGVTAVTSGTAIELFKDYLTKNSFAEITTTGIKIWLTSMGRSPTSCRYIIDLGVQAGLIKPTKVRGKYLVTQKRSK